jgi:peptide/nickel transport system permease protein
VSQVVVESPSAPAARQAPPSLARTLVSSAEGRAGLAISAVMLAVIAIGPLLAPRSPTAMGAALPLEGPSRAHLLGTDDLGRDVLSRFLHGGAVVVLLPLLAVTIALLVGGSLGIISAYVGGRFDRALTRVFDLLLILPQLLVALVLIAGLGTSSAVIVLTVGIVYAPRIGRLIRGAALGVVRNDYVVAAHLRGENLRWIATRELLPNIMGQVLAAYSLYLTYCIIFVATLSFLGLGEQPPSSDWGLMVAEGRGFIEQNPAGTIAPALGIAGVSVAFTLIADAVNRHLSRDTATLDAGT